MQFNPEAQLEALDFNSTSLSSLVPVKSWYYGITNGLALDAGIEFPELHPYNL
jgi:hypothetical protein